MGTTKAFIKNPETVRVLLFAHPWLIKCPLCSCLLWKRCEIDIGITWQVASNGHGETIGVIRTSLRPASSASGKTIRRPSPMQSSETTGPLFWLVEKSVGASVFWVRVVSWATTWTSEAQMRLGRRSRKRAALAPVNRLCSVTEYNSWCPSSADLPSSVRDTSHL